MIFNLALYLLSLLAVTRSQTQIQTFWPAAAPLAVHSPYFNVWQSAISTNDYPIFWNGSVLGWVGFIRVDGSTYRWLGNNYDMSGSVGAVGCNVTFTEVTPTRTIQNVQAGPMNVTVTFLSPIEPSDWVKQSIPFSYLAVEFASTDGKEHDVQLYSDISAEWVSANRETVEWSSNQTDTVVYHSIMLEQPQPFTEAYQQASDGTAYYAMSLGSGPSAGWQTCQDTVCYETFYASGAVNSKNNNDTYRGITTDLPVFAFSMDFGSVSATQSPVVWAVGYARDPSIEYSLEGEVTTLRPYYSTQYSNIEDIIEAFVSDYDNALSRAETLDSQVQQAATNVSSGSEYYNMLSLATRQAFGALDLTAPGSDGSIRFFMKDIGFSNRVNPVESLYAALPVYLYCNASMVKSLLLPLLEQQNASSYTSYYAARDIGASYPSVSGPTAASNESVEQSGNMLIMVLAHAVHAGDSSLLGSYYALLKTWADYLVTNALYPSNQASVDTGDVASNSTNLALKGIIGIQAMSNISLMLGKDDDAQHYSSVALQYIGSWKALAMSSDSSHILPTYADSSSAWSLSYNIYAHTLLDLHLLDDTIFSSITSYYQELLSNYAYGPPIDSDHDTLGSAVWTSFTAAALTDTSTRQQMLSHLWKFASSNTTAYPFPSRYTVSNGSYLGGTASPAQGALFASLALSGSRFNTSNSPTTSSLSSSGHHSTPVGAVVGGVVGGVIAFLLVAFAVCFFRRKRRALPTVEPSVSSVLPEKNGDAIASPSRFVPARSPSTPASVSGDTLFIGGSPSSISGPMVIHNSPGSVIVLGHPPSATSSDVTTTAMTGPSVPASPLSSLPTLGTPELLELSGPSPLSSSRTLEVAPRSSSKLSPSLPQTSPSPSSSRQDVKIHSSNAPSQSTSSGHNRDRDAELADLRNDMQQLRQELRRVVPVLEQFEEPPPDYWAQ